MNITGTGLDIVETGRIRRSLEKFGDRFINRCFLPGEIAYCQSMKFPELHFAARFAAKEAVVKAIGQPRKFPVKWTDVEVLNDKEGKPMIEFRGDAAKLKKTKKIGEVILSMSHSRNYAIANVILLKG